VVQNCRLKSVDGVLKAFKRCAPEGRITITQSLLTFAHRIEL
jgi:hypothetical protein